jgi:zinc-binding alcohol dehydrogenase family protein
MKAVALMRYLAISDPESLIDVELEKPIPSGHDLLVRIEAIGMNPIDTKVRAPKDRVEKTPRVLGWDASGVVEAVGSNVTLFNLGDAVFYAGSVTRPGANSEYHLVDERIVGSKPRSLDFSNAAALPLTPITSWEALFSRLRISERGGDSGKSLLIIGAAGGVGSIAIQLAKKVAGLVVVATASRPESITWARNLGADLVINHLGDMLEQLRDVGINQVDYVLVLNNIDRHFATAVGIVKPQGAICSIVENEEPLRIELLKAKSASFHWESMFTRSTFGTSDMIEQHNILIKIANLVEAGTIKTTLACNLGLINATNVREAHRRLEGGRVIGKLTLAGF